MRVPEDYARKVRLRLAEAIGGTCLKEIAQRTGLPYESVRRALHSNAEPSLELIVRVCSAFDICTDWVLLGHLPRRRSELERDALSEVSIAHLFEEIGGRLRDMEANVGENGKPKQPHPSLPFKAIKQNGQHPRAAAE